MPARSGAPGAGRIPNGAPAGACCRNKSVATAPKTATASTPARRLAALLIPDAAPDLLPGAAFITAVVNGETAIDIPTPSAMTGATTAVQKLPAASASP